MVVSNTRVQALVNSTKINILPKHILVSSALEYRKKLFLKQRDYHAAQIIYSLQEGVLNMYIVDYIRHQLVVDYTKIAWRLTYSEYKEYKIGILHKIARTYNSYASECFTQILIIQKRIPNNNNRRAYIGNRLNLRSKNHTQRRREAAKKKKASLGISPDKENDVSPQ